MGQQRNKSKLNKSLEKIETEKQQKILDCLKEN